MKMDPYRRKILARRRQVPPVHTRHLVERADPAKDGAAREKHTCSVCNTTSYFEWRESGGRPIPTNKVSDRLAKYRSSASGVLGKCAECTKRRRDERHPLPKAEA